MAMQQSEIPVVGMTCANCAKSIETSVSKLNGVHSATVQFATKKLMVDFDPQEIALERIVDTVTGLGYEVPSKTTDESEEDRLRQKRFRSQLILLVIGIVFTIPLFMVSMARDFTLLDRGRCGLGELVILRSCDSGTDLGRPSLLRRGLSIASARIDGYGCTRRDGIDRSVSL